MRRPLFTLQVFIPVSSLNPDQSIMIHAGCSVIYLPFGSTESKGLT